LKYGSRQSLNRRRPLAVRNRRVSPDIDAAVGTAQNAIADPRPLQMAARLDFR
jgi:hypothetical protein